MKSRHETSLELPSAADQPPPPIYTGPHDCEVIPAYSSPPTFRVKCLAPSAMCGWAAIRVFHSFIEAEQAGEDHKADMRAKNARRRKRRRQLAKAS